MHCHLMYPSTVFLFLIFSTDPSFLARFGLCRMLYSLIFIICLYSICSSFRFWLPFELINMNVWEWVQIWLVNPLSWHHISLSWYRYKFFSFFPCRYCCCFTVPCFMAGIKPHFEFVPLNFFEIYCFHFTISRFHLILIIFYLKC